jgi:hypothetical protein
MIKSLFVLVAALLSGFAGADGCWTRKSDFPAAGMREPLSFAVGPRGYVGVTEYGSGKFYEYRSKADTWLAKADMPEGFRFQAPAFSLHGKAHVIIGNEPWSFDPFVAKWNRLSAIPAGDMRAAFAFAIGGHGYAGGGFYNDASFWRYDPGQDTWTRLADLPTYLAGCVLCSAFVLGRHAYVGGSGFWRYDPAADRWEEKSDVDVIYGRLFSIGETGYALNTDGVLFRYYENLDRWGEVSRLPGQAVCFPMLFAMEGRMIVGMGGVFRNGTCTLTPGREVWQYVPGELCGQ